jgi:hypothetical protein
MKVMSRKLPAVTCCLKWLAEHSKGSLIFSAEYTSTISKTHIWNFRLPLWCKWDLCFFGISWTAWLLKMTNRLSQNIDTKPLCTLCCVKSKRSLDLLTLILSSTTWREFFFSVCQIISCWDHCHARSWDFRIWFSRAVYCTLFHRRVWKCHLQLVSRPHTFWKYFLEYSGARFLKYWHFLFKQSYKESILWLDSL